MAVHWTIPFRSLRSNTLYTVNIYDSTYSGNPIPLKGGSKPFYTQEADDDDQFMPVRTQSGYIRIVDDGYAADGITAFNWKDILPSTDTDRPVTLTDGNGNIVWQGFMQAQNFSGTLYGNPQEREYPIQCPLTILEGSDINFAQKGIQNFAYLLKQIIDAIPTISFTEIIIHGINSWGWLEKRIDWQNYLKENDETMEPRFNLFTCLEDMCRFWGWTARTHKQKLYFTQADDTNENEDYITLTMQILEAVANNHHYGTATGTPATITMSGDIFATVNNDDYRQRGFSKATVSANTNKADENLIDLDTDEFEEQTSDQGWGGLNIAVGDGKPYRYTNDLLSYATQFMTGTCYSGLSSFNIARYYSQTTPPVSYEETNVLRLKSGYSSTVKATFEMIYEHCYSQNELEIHFKAFYNTERVANQLYVRVGIGNTRATAKWLTSLSGVTWQWGDTPTDVKLCGQQSSDLALFEYNGVYTGSIKVPLGVSGLLFIDIMGNATTLPANEDIGDFFVKMFHGPRAIGNDPDSYAIVYNENVAATKVYTATNGNKIRNEWNADCIFASDNDALFGYGILMNPHSNGGSYMEEITHDNTNYVWQEQYLADRVSNYWATSKRMIHAELRSDVTVGGTQIANFTPLNTFNIDGTKMASIAFGHEWRDDITILTLLEI